MSYTGPRIDLDVHHTWRSPRELLPYLPQRWRQVVEQGQVGLKPAIYHHPAARGIYARMDAIPDSGGPAGSSLEMMQAQLLDRYNIQHAVVSFNVGFEAGVTNVLLATELARAANRWSIERWLSGQDERLYGAVLIPTQDIDAAATELRIVGQHDRMVEALLILNGVGKPYGHPLYHPIFQAACDLDMAVGIHTGGETTIHGAATHIAAGGPPLTRFQRHVVMGQPIQHYLLSMIVYGVFDKYPGLRLILKEPGVGWLPSFMWEIDAHRDQLESEGVFLKRWPSDYIRNHVWISSQPLEEPSRPRDLTDLLSTFDWLEDRICFSSDYPHHDTDDADYIGRRIPRSWWDKFFHDNAAAAYGWHGASTVTSLPVTG
jgi:predicted TIM-barrel fold metal-dependent hydrolase